MVKVDLINPIVRWEEPDHPSPPLGLLYLATALQKGDIGVEIIDGNTISEELFNEKIQTSNASHVGITSTFFSLESVRKVLNIIPDGKKVTVGGPGISSILDKEKFMRELPRIDYLLEGEAEQSYVQLVTSSRPQECIPGLTYYSKEKIATNKGLVHTDINVFPVPNRSFVDMEKYKVYGNETGMITSRGCPKICTFCDHQVAGSSIRYRESKNIIEEILDIKNVYGFNDIFIFDDFFAASSRRLESLISIQKEEGITVGYGASSRVDIINEKKVNLLAESGCNRIYFGVESGSQKILDYYEKGITVEQIIKAFSLCHSVGIAPHAFILFGAPIEDEKDVALTYKLLDKINPASVDSSIVTPIPGTRLYKETSDIINHKKLWSLDSRTEGSVYTSLKIDPIAERKRCLDTYGVK